MSYLGKRFPPQSFPQVWRSAVSAPGVARGKCHIRSLDYEPSNEGHHNDGPWRAVKGRCGKVFATLSDRPWSGGNAETLYSLDTQESAPDFRDDVTVPAWGHDPR